MKKNIFILITIIAILLIILLLKNVLTTSKYSSEDIQKLFLKGQETLDNADNVYYERHTESTISKHYYKGAKEKHESIYKNGETEIKILTTITNFDDNTVRRFDHSAKYISNRQAGKPGISLQSNLTSLLEHKDYYASVEFSYVKDEELEGKDCICIKTLCYDKKSNEIRTDSRGSVDTYWIEKSTGFIVGFGDILLEDDSATTTATTVVRNLSFGTVKDSDFEEPEL